MGGFYIKDLNTTRRSLADIQPILKLIFPQNLIIERQTTTAHGFLFYVPFDRDANFICNPRVEKILKEKNLEGQLTNKTANTRNVFLKSIPDQINDKDLKDITEEIVKVTKHRVLQLRTFKGNRSNRNYIILTADSQADRDAILNLGPLQLFGFRIETEKPLEKDKNGNVIHNPSHYHPNGGNTAQGHQQSSPPSTTPHVWSLNNITWPRLPIPTPFRGEPTHMHPGNTDRPRFDNAFGQVSQPIFRNRAESDFYVEATATICMKLNEGLDRPGNYVNMLNTLYRAKGLPMIDIPNDLLISSRNIFEQKNNIHQHPIPSSPPHPPSNLSSLPQTNLTPHTPSSPTHSLPNISLSPQTVHITNSPSTATTSALLTPTHPLPNLSYPASITASTHSTPTHTPQTSPRTTPTNSPSLTLSNITPNCINRPIYIITNQSADLTKFTFSRISPSNITATSNSTATSNTSNLN